VEGKLYITSLFHSIMEIPKWPNRLVIVRHGQSQQNIALDLFQEGIDTLIKKMYNTRDADVALTRIGHWQAKQTGTFLADTEPFDICFCSPYTRTLETAEGIIAHLPYALRILSDNRIREKEFGRFHGLTTEDIQTQYPEEFADRQREGKYWYRLLRGENYPDVELRVHSFLGKLTRDWREKSVLLVTHHVPYLLLIAFFLQELLKYLMHILAYRN